jgi:DNA polymerase-3 subunit delta
MKPTDLFAKFEEGALLPLYYFYGEDQCLLDLAIQCVEKQGEFDEQDALSYEIFYGGATPLVTILESARSLPFLGSKKLVVVRETEKIPQADHKKLFAYAEKPSSKSTLVFAERLVKKGGWQTKKPSFGKKLMDSIAQKGMVLSLPQSKRGEIPSWIQYLADAEGKTISNDGLALLRDLVGDSVQDLAAAMERLALFVGMEECISRAAVEQSISRLRVESVFELADHIGSGRRKQALGALSRLLDSDEQPLFILTMITRQFRLIFTAHILLDHGASFREVQKNLNVQDFVVKKLVPQTRSFSRARLEACYERLWKTDWALKSSSIPEKVLLEQLVLDLCG